MKLIITDDYLYNDKKYKQANRTFIGVENPKYLWGRVQESESSYEEAKSECKRAYGFYYKKETSTTSSIKILDVSVVRGSSIKSYWKGDMQKVKTSKGTYIDTLNNCDWDEYIGRTLDSSEYYIKNSSGHLWIQKA